MQLGSTFLKNALSNLVRGGAGTLVALALPHFLSAALDAERFAVWALVLQIAAYANYLDFGLQTAIARFIAQALELRQDDRRDQLVSTSMALLFGASALAYAIIGMVVWQLPHLFHEVPAALHWEFSAAALILSASAVLVIGLASFPSTLLGLQRNDLVALAIGSTRLAGAFAAIVASRYTQSLIVLACCIGGMNLLGSLVQIAMTRRLLPGLHLAVGNVRRSMASELARYCAGLTVWNVGLLLVSGMDLLLVGHYHFESVGSYSIALSAAAMFAGVNSYLVTALLSPLAVLHARRDMKSIARIMLGVTSVNVLANGMVVLATFMFGLPLLTMWVRPYAVVTLPILQILMVAQAIRLSGLTFSVTLVAIGEQNKGMAQGWVEALVNLVCSLVGVVWFGPIGVAWGTLLGAICSLGWICFVTLRRVEELPVSRWEFLGEGVLRPLSCLLPILVLAVVAHHLSFVREMVAGIMALLLTGYFVRRTLSVGDLVRRGATLQG